ncbi:MAG: hypothetical protein IT318_03035, partial [Anaerolineales bacterium]|nr:hypothetical protein [Anaerolineales bacterium]
MTRPALSSRATWAVLAGLAILGGVFRLAGLAQVPPGQFLDESLVSIIARDLAAAGKFPVYIGHGGGGYYPAIIYLTRLARWLSGGHPLAARGGVALLSALSLPLIFLALRAIFALDEPRPRAAGLALLAAGVVAVSVPDAIISRGGAEMTLTTPLAALTYLGLAAGLRASKRWMFAAAGAALGLSLYTYYSARLLPLGVAGALLWIAWAERPAARGPLAGLLLTAGAALAAALPLGAYFWQHPDIFFARALTTSQALRTGQTGLPAALAISTLHTLAGLVWPGAGDALARHNLPGRAFFDAFTALLFV